MRRSDGSQERGGNGGGGHLAAKKSTTLADGTDWSRQSLPPLPCPRDIRSADQSAEREDRAKTTSTTTCRPPVKKVKRSGSSRRIAGGSGPRKGSRGGNNVAASQTRDDGSERAEKYRSLTEFESNAWQLLRQENGEQLGASQHFCG